MRILIHFAKVFGIVWATITLAYIFIPDVAIGFHLTPVAATEEHDGRSVLGMACGLGFGDCGFLGVDCGGAYFIPF